MTYATKTRIGKRKKQIGALGEALVVKHLTNKGFTHIESNYLRRQGEIDVVMEFDGRIHFIEVKTVSREKYLKKGDGVIHETSHHKPEENVSRLKMFKMAKVVQMYLQEKKFEERDWQFDVAVVYLDQKNKKAYIKFIKDIPLSA